jgi:hypothetical protein
MLQRHHESFHSTWGQLTKTGYSNSRFAHQVGNCCFCFSLTPVYAVISAAFTSSSHYASDCFACATCSWSAMRACIPGTGEEIYPQLCMLISLYTVYEL